MNKKMWELLKRPILASERSKWGLLILKRILFLALAVSIAAWALPKSVFLTIFRIDAWEELREITWIDLWTGPVAALLVFLLAHEYLPRGKFRRFEMTFYLAFAIYISTIFLMVHVNQVSVRSGQHPWDVISSLLKNDR